MSLAEVRPIRAPRLSCDKLTIVRIVAPLHKNGTGWMMFLIMAGGKIQDGQKTTRNNLHLYRRGMHKCCPAKQYAVIRCYNHYSQYVRIVNYIICPSVARLKAKLEGRSRNETHKARKPEKISGFSWMELLGSSDNPAGRYYASDPDQGSSWLLG